MFRKFFRKASPQHVFGLSVILVIITLSLGIILYWQNFKNAEKGEILATQQKSLVLVRAGALVIDEFLKSREGELMLLAQDEEAANLRNKDVVRKKLEIIVDKLADTPVSDAVRVDKEGKVVLVVNPERITQGEGIDVFDRDYFLWAQKKENRDKIFISQPISPRGGAHPKEMIFTMTAPTYFNDQFTGLIFFSFRASQFTEKYVLPLRIYNQTYAFLITEEGVLIGGEATEFLGKNLFDYTREKKWSGWESYIVTLKQAFQGEGVGEWFFAAPNEQKPGWKIVAFSPIKIGEAKIALLAITPKEASRSLFLDLSRSQNLIFILLVLALLALILWDISLHLARREGFLDGAKNGYAKGIVDGQKKT